ncbi:MAG: hypothetical protein PHS97_01230 [Oscillospiraceae bacterium]|nr:hypothetical protein [Oscillospiraceae bacterium]
MPRNQFQRTVFAFLTVLITVHAYVFYSLYVVNGAILMQASGAGSVLGAIAKQGGVLMFGRMLPIWAVILIEFCFAFALELCLGSPASFRLASRAFDPRKNHPVIFETAIICATVGIMCPAMSFLAAWMYYPYDVGFHPATLLANWLKLVCFNLPFAYFSQLFFIQPLIRTVFKFLFRKEIAQRQIEKPKPQTETDAIEDVIVRKQEIRAGK